MGGNHDDGADADDATSKRFSRDSEILICCAKRILVPHEQGTVFKQ